MRIREMPTEEKPREKLLRMGRESLSTVELLAVIIGTGSEGKSALELAGEVMATDSQGLRFLADCVPEELMTINGMGTAKSCQLLAAVEIGKRLATMPPVDCRQIRSSEDVSELFMEKLRHEKKEHFYCLMINSKGKVIEETEVSVGDLNSSQTHPREVFARAVRRSAGSVIFIHNHPSGDPEPSDADIETTMRLKSAGELLGIPVLDHLIIGDGVFVSMKARDII